MPLPSPAAGEEPRVMLPQIIASIDAAWLTAALAMGYPGTIVTEATIGTIIRGTATKLRLMLDYNDEGHAHGLPPTMWFKGGLEAHSASPDMLSVYANEAGFYADVAPRLAMTLPHCYFVHVDPTSGQSAILFEDMLARNARFGYATRPASPQLAASVLGQLARLHGAFWNSNVLNNKASLAGGGAALDRFLQAFLYNEENWARCLALPRGRFLRGEMRDLGAMREAVRTMLAWDRQHQSCLVHGDAHLGNACILPGEQASFLDWQTTMIGFWAHDVSYFLTAAMTVADRRVHERDLVAHYGQRVERVGWQTGPGDRPGSNTVAMRFTTFCWFPCNPEWQPEEVAATNTERAVAAIQDLDTLACWRN